MRAVYLIAAAHVVGLEHVGVDVQLDVVLLRRKREDRRLLCGLFHPDVLDHCAFLQLGRVDR